MKLKGIDGGPHKRRNMWRGTLPGLELQRTVLETGFPFGAAVKVLHGCRQLVP